MSSAVIYDTRCSCSSAFSPRSFKDNTPSHFAEFESRRPLSESSSFRSVGSFQDPSHSFSMPPKGPVQPGVSRIDIPSLADVNGLSRSCTNSFDGHAYPYNGNSHAERSSHSPSDNSRSARMRRALSVPARGASNTQSRSSANDFPCTPRLARLQPIQSGGQHEIIAEFGSKDFAIPYPFPDCADLSRNSYCANAVIPPRLQTPQNSSTRSRSKPRRPEEDLPPRFRNLPRIATAPHSLWSETSVHTSTRPLNSLAITFHPQLSQAHHLSSFLSSNVSYTSGIPSDTRSTPQQDSKYLDTHSKPRPLAPIGAERAQRLASNANIIPSNHCINTTSINLKVESPCHKSADRSLPPSSLGPLSFSSKLAAQGSLQPQHPGSTVPARLFRSCLGQDATSPEIRTELENLYRRSKLKANKFSPKVYSPLSPLRNPESWAPSDVKWRMQEKEQRRQHIFSSCENSAFKRKTTDRRSRIECEEFFSGVEVSEHCLWCRQDTLCKRLLVHRARELMRSNSSSPSSDYSSSSDEAISDEDRLLTPADDLSQLSGKIGGLEHVTIVEAGYDETINLDCSSPAPRTQLSLILDYVDM